MPEPAEWSSDVGEADWLTGPVNRAEFGTVGSLVPAGFEAFCRLLHPAYADNMCQLRVRWLDVARWSGRTLDGLSEFHSVAFPVGEPSSPPPWHISPEEGSIDPHDLEVLVGMLRLHTGNPDDCWMGIWNGYGISVPLIATGSGGSQQVDVTVKELGPPPEIAANLPLVEANNRDYYLLHGTLETALAIDRYVDIPAFGPSVFWPADRAWCVATDVDLAWTYVGGSAQLINALVDSSDIEVVQADPEDACGHTEPWVEEMATQAADDLIRTGSATVVTYFGVIRAHIDHSGLGGRQLGLSRVFGDQEVGTSWTVLGQEPVEDHRRSIEYYIASDIARLAG